MDRRDDLSSAIRELFERIASAVPALREWEQSLSDDEFLESEWSQLAREIVALAPDDTISALTTIAPALEEALERHDDHDQVSLGFIESLISQAEGKQLDPMRVRSTLGPVARIQWDSLSDHLHQLDWSLVHFDIRHIAGFVTGPARLEQWLVKRGAKVPAESSVARVMSGSVYYDLVATLPCRVDRFAVSAGQPLTEEDLLLYLLPDDYRQFRRSSPYVALRTGATGPAA